MKKKLLFVGGIINVLFTIFHVWLAWQISQITGLSSEIHALLLMLAFGGTLMIGFAAYASLFCIQQMLTTRLGKATMILVVLIYSTRALEEIVIAPKFSPLIFSACLVTALVYLLALTLPQKEA
ncbi:MAG TPA: hypothetical protein PLP19_20335 [bacterium]|nr:hypothetical protein [bacterium]HPN45845.1 hypothetical protein [bacterium]